MSLYKASEFMAAVSAAKPISLVLQQAELAISRNLEDIGPTDSGFLGRMSSKTHVLQIVLVW